MTAALPSCLSFLVVVALSGLSATAQPNGYYNVAPPGQAPVPVATGNDYAPTPAGAAIILRTDVQLRLQTNRSFLGQDQTNFATALRSLLSPYQFMSVAVSGFQMGNGYVDVTTRIVDFPSDAGTLAGIWHDIASQLVVNNTLLPALNSLLSALNVTTSAQLLSLQGAADPTQPQVSLALNITAAQTQSSFQAASVLEPLSTFLGDHVTSVQLAGSSAASATQTVATVSLVGLEPDQIPQLWLYVLNSTALSAGGISLTTTGYQVAAETPAPTVAASPPPTGPVQAPPPAAAASTNPPPATAANPTVTMTVAMRIFGSDVVPFTPTAQFVAASALAGVFSIVIGVGSVQISSSAPAPPGALPTTSAASGSRKLLAHAGLIEQAPTFDLPRVHIRSLQQASGTAPAVDVSFAVGLPAASRNSLLVVQSASPVVRSQFAGWFVYAMGGQGYNVNAEITNITAEADPVAAPAKKGSSHTGAIVGGVVGGLVGLLLILALAGFVILQHRRKTRRTVVRSPASDASEDLKRQKLMSSSDLDGKAKAGPFTMSTLYTSSEEGITSGPHRNPYPSDPSTALSSTTVSDNARSLDGRKKAGSDFSAGAMSDIDRLAHRRHRREASLSTGSSSDASMQSLLSYLEQIRPGSTFYGKYAVEQGVRRGPHTAMIFGHAQDDPSQEVAIKLFPGESAGRFVHEKLFFDNRGALDPVSQHSHLEKLLDSFLAHRAVVTEECVPPALVLERGACTLHEWLGGASKLAGRPEDAERIGILHQVLCAVDFLHQRRLVHRRLTPRAVMHFPQAAAGGSQWKLVSLGAWARSGDPCAMEVYDLHYAAPELLHVDLNAEEEIVAREATDLWAVGAMAFEILCGRSLYPPSLGEHEITGALLGAEEMSLPWEANPDYFASSLSPAACSLVQDLLVRSPQGRKPLRTALLSPLFQRVLTQSA